MYQYDQRFGIANGFFSKKFFFHFITRTSILQPNHTPLCLFLKEIAKPAHKKMYNPAQYFQVILNLRKIGHQPELTSFQYSYHTQWKLRF